MKKSLILCLMMLHNVWAGKVTEYFGFGKYDDEKRVWYAKTYDGTVEATFDDEGNNQGASRYSAFGKRISDVGSAVDREAFQGQDFRAGVGHYNLGFRNMKEESGQWLQPEPLLIVASQELADPLKYTPYRYGRNAPTIYTDFSGLACGDMAGIKDAYYNGDSQNPQICNADGMCIESSPGELPSCNDVSDLNGVFCTLDWRDDSTWYFFRRAAENGCFTIEATSDQNSVGAYSLPGLARDVTGDELPVGLPFCDGQSHMFVLPDSQSQKSLADYFTNPIVNDSVSDSIDWLFFNECPGLSSLGPDETMLYRVSITSPNMLRFVLDGALSCRALDDVNRHYGGMGANARFIQALFHDLPEIPKTCNPDKFIFYFSSPQSLQTSDSGS